MRNGILALSFVGIVSLCGVARAETFEVPLPEAVGDYALYGWKQLNVNVGFPLAQINDVRFRVEGTIVGPWASGPFVEEGPMDAFFHMSLGDPPGPVARGPGVGGVAYPGPKPFVGEAAFTPVGSLLEDGVTPASIFFGPTRGDIETEFVGGRGTITAAWLIVDATAVPEPGGMALSAVGVWALSRRCRRR